MIDYVIYTFLANAVLVIDSYDFRRQVDVASVLVLYYDLHVISYLYSILRQTCILLYKYIAGTRHSEARRRTVRIQEWNCRCANQGLGSSGS